MLSEGIDFYINETGYVVFTTEYHLKRGYCCGNGCLNCPWAKAQKNERELNISTNQTFKELDI